MKKVCFVLVIPTDSIALIAVTKPTVITIGKR